MGNKRNYADGAKRADMATEQLTELESSLDTMLANYTKEEKEIKEAEATYRWQDGTYEK